MSARRRYGTRAERAKRDARILTLYTEGLATADVAARYAVTPAVVRHVTRRAGVWRGRGMATPPTDDFGQSAARRQRPRASRAARGGSEPGRDAVGAAEGP
jgi:hypothetical protein